MAKERSYGFLTTDSSMLEVKASSPEQAQRRAKEKLEYYKKLYKGKDYAPKKDAMVSSSYVTYGKYGFTPAGIYKQVRTSARRSGRSRRSM